MYKRLICVSLMYVLYQWNTSYIIEIAMPSTYKLGTSSIRAVKYCTVTLDPRRFLFFNGIRFYKRQQLLLSVLCTNYQ